MKRLSGPLPPSPAVRRKNRRPPIVGDSTPSAVARRRSVLAVPWRPSESRQSRHTPDTTIARSPRLRSRVLGRIRVRVGSVFGRLLRQTPFDDRLARSMLSPTFVMVPFLRVLLWIVALVAPGGVLLVPILAAQALRRPRSEPRTRVEPTSPPSDPLASSPAR